jgi:arginine exporter protein ArgO
MPSFLHGINLALSSFLRIGVKQLWQLLQGILRQP